MTFGHKGGGKREKIRKGNVCDDDDDDEEESNAKSRVQDVS